MRKLSDRRMDRRTDRGTDRQRDKSDFTGCCLTNVERTIEKFFKNATNNRHI